MLLGILLSVNANAQTVTTEHYRYPKNEKYLSFAKLASLTDSLGLLFGRWSERPARVGSAM